MSEKKNIQENKDNKTEDTKAEFSEIKKTEDFSSPEGPSSDIPEIRCPLCPKFAQITINHIKNEIISECPDNHYMKLDFLSFIERSTDHPIVCTKCSVCNSTGKTNNYCLECNKYFCIECLEKHNKNELPYNNGGVYSNILLKNNNLETNGNSKVTPSDNLNTSFPNHLTTLNLVNNNNSVMNNTVQHHIININECDNKCAIHQNEKFVCFCMKCNKSFCQKCMEEISKGLKNNLSAISCGKFGNLHHNLKKIKDIIGEKKLNKIKQGLAKEAEILNYIENQSNIIIEQILEKINNLREIHLLKEQLYNLYLLNQENSSLVKTMHYLSNGSTLQTSQFNTSEKLLSNLEIINLELPKEKKESQKNVQNDNEKKEDLKVEDKKEEDKKLEEKKEKIKQSKIEKKNELKKLKEEKKKQIQQMKEEKKKEIKKKKEELKKIRQEKKKEEKIKKKGEKHEKKGEENDKKGEGDEEIPSSEVNAENNNQDLNNGNSSP